MLLAPSRPDRHSTLDAIRSALGDAGLPLVGAPRVPLTLGEAQQNKIEHRLFSFVSDNWRGQPRIDMRGIVGLIGATTTQTGLVVDADCDNTWYAKGVRITKKQQAQIPITPTSGTANGTTQPRHKSRGEPSARKGPHSPKKDS